MVSYWPTLSGENEFWMSVAHCVNALISAAPAPLLARMAASLLLAAVGLQLAIGITMVWRGFPLWIATAHNAGAALLLLATLSLYKSLR